MVVLSACNTGTGELQRGEGVISLARGFAFAGAKSIISTLWSVNDKSTEVLMSSFYKHLKSGMKKDEALRKAKQDYRRNPKNDAHPFYWAAFIPSGDMSALDLNTQVISIQYKSWVLLLIIIMLIILMKSRYFK